MPIYDTQSTLHLQTKFDHNITMLVILLLCITHDVVSIHYRENNDINRQFGKHSNIYDNRYRNILSKKFGEKYYNDLDYSNVYFGSEPRRLFDWLKNMIKRSTTDKTTPKYEDVVNESIRFREIENNLTVTLTELSYVLNQILNIVKYARQDHFHDFQDHLQHALDKNKHISKRNAADKDIETNSTESDNRNTTVDNKSQSSNDSSGRRALIGSQVLVTTDEVKNKLFNYIEEGFSEIRNKINSLQTVKNMFSKDIRYKIGYIVANIDTLNANMRNLKNNMATNKYIWNDNKILNLYDTIKMSNRAVTNLIDVLKEYVENSLTSNYSKK